MNTPGRIKGRTPASLKDAYAQLVDACGGDVPAGNIAQKSKSQVQRYTDEGDPDCQMPMLVVLALEAACRQPIVTRFMAMATGHVLLNTSPTDDTPLGQDLAKVGQEMAQLFAEVGAALADGKICAAEAARIVERCMGGVVALADVIAEMRAIQKAAI